MKWPDSQAGSRGSDPPPAKPGKAPHSGTRGGLALSQAGSFPRTVVQQVQETVDETRGRHFLFLSEKKNKKQKQTISKVKMYLLPEFNQ